MYITVHNFLVKLVHLIAVFVVRLTEEDRYTDAVKVIGERSEVPILSSELEWMRHRLDELEKKEQDTGEEVSKVPENKIVGELRFKHLVDNMTLAEYFLREEE